MKSLLNVLWVLLAVTSAQANDVVPDLFTKEQFNAATMAQAANHYIGLGEVKAIEALKALEEDHVAAIDEGINTNERIGWICRIIFLGKEGKPLRQPQYGGLRLPYLTMPLERWPLYPIAQSDQVFFVLSEGYVLGGLAERASKYIDYCSTTGSFRTTQVKVPLHEDAIKAFNTLRESNHWKMIKWTDQGPGSKYTMNEESILRYIEAQATSIPKR